MLLTMPLASDEGDHLPATFDAVLTRDSIGVTVPFVSFRAGRSTKIAAIRSFSFLLLIVGEGGNSRRRTIPQAVVPGTYQAGRGREGAARPASSTARIPVRKMPSNVPAPPIEATGAPRPLILSRLDRSAPISVPIESPV